MKYCLGFLCLLLVSPLQAQDLVGRIAQLEAVTAQTAKDVTEIKDRLARIEAKLNVSATDPFSDANATKVPARKGSYTTPYAGSTKCDCGCIETGKCVCQNCNSPAKTAPIGDCTKIPGSQGCLEDCEYVQYRMVCDGDACRMVRLPDSQQGKKATGRVYYYYPTLGQYHPSDSPPTSPVNYGSYGSCGNYGNYGSCSSGTCGGATYYGSPTYSTGYTTSSTGQRGFGGRRSGGGGSCGS